MRESELKTEIRLLNSILEKKGEITRRNLSKKKESLLVELLNIEDLNAKVIREKRVDYGDFSVRALNCMKAADIWTVNDLINAWPLKPYEYRNLGKKTLEEIELFLLKNNLIK